MGAFETTLIVATLLCSLVAGFVLSFAVVVMPGLRYFDDRSFLRAFKLIDGVIQNNQPVFMLVWVGSVFSLVIASLLSLWHLQGTDRFLLLVATAAYLVGVQVSTFTINVPLNNQLQAMDLEGATDMEIETARSSFEPRWNRWNTIRTAVATLVSLVLLMLLFRL